MSNATDFGFFLSACYRWRDSDDLLAVEFKAPGFTQYVIEAFCCLNGYDYYNRQVFPYGFYSEVTAMVKAQDTRLRDKILSLKRTVKAYRKTNYYYFRSEALKGHEKIIKARRDRNLRPSDLGELAFIELKRIIDIEMGVVKPTGDELLAIAEALNTTIADLLGLPIRIRKDILEA